MQLNCLISDGNKTWIYVNAAFPSVECSGIELHDEAEQGQNECQKVKIFPVSLW